MHTHETEMKQDVTPEGIVFDIRRGVTKDGPGLRTSVFLKGCPLRCAWCHNPESQSPHPERAVTTGEMCGRRMSVENVMEEVRRDAVFYSASGGGVTFTGGEPLFQPEFTAALAAAALAEGISVAIDTSGFAPWGAFEAILRSRPPSDVARQTAGRTPPSLLFLYDLKCMDPERHRALTGVDNATILENLRRLDASGGRIWIRCPLVPGLNDSDSDLAAIRAFVSALHGVERLDILPYHQLGLEKYAKFGKNSRPDLPGPPSPSDIDRWRRALPSPKPA